MKENIVLIGMPGAGKSTVGVVLAKAAGMDFLDTDLLIQKHEGTTLQRIIDERGNDEFRKTEDAVLSKITAENTVIATGGSAVYGERAMANLKSLGKVCYIKLREESVERRILNLSSRGIAMRRGQTLAELYEERRPLYEKYADFTVEADSLTIEETVKELLEACGCAEC